MITVAFVCGNDQTANDFAILMTCNRNPAWPHDYWPCPV